MKGYNSNSMSSGSTRRSQRKQIKTDSTRTKSDRISSVKGESIPTRRDSIASAYHHMHTDAKTPEYMNNPYYDTSKKRAKKIAKKFPSLDAYMRNKKNRAKIGYDYE
tara:strand:- start:208 stop:528 length:321 start_codon:yes stop_codon:yes gene_type:complete